jgi:hypothetical protein
VIVGDQDDLEGDPRFGEIMMEGLYHVVDALLGSIAEHYG